MMPRVNTDAGDMRASAVWAAGPAASAESIRALRLVLDVPARLLAVEMAGQEEARLAPSRTLAMLSLPPAARAPAAHAVLAIISAV